MIKVKNLGKNSLNIRAAGAVPIKLKADAVHEFKSAPEYLPYEKVIVNLVASGRVLLEKPGEKKLATVHFLSQLATLMAMQTLIL